MTKSALVPVVRVAITLLVGIFALMVGFLGYIFLTLDPNQWRIPLEQALSQSTGRQIAVGRLRFGTIDGVGIRTDQVTIRDSQQRLEGEARDMLVEVELWPLLWQKINVRKITFDRLNLKVGRDRQGRWSIADLLSRPVQNEQFTFDPQTSVVQLSRATVTITDESQVPSRNFQLVGLDLQVGGSANPDDPLPISLQGIVDDLGQQTVIALEGRVRLPVAPSEPWLGDLQLLVSGMQPQSWESYWRPWLMSNNLQGLMGLNAGRLDLDLRWQAQANGALAVVGKIGAKGLIWRWPQIFGAQPWVTPNLVLDLNLAQTNGQWQVKPLILNLGPMAITLEGQLSGDQLSLQAISNEFDPYVMRPRLPVNLIPKPLAPWLLTSTGKGKLKLKGQTNGTLNQLTTTGQIDLLGLGLKTSSMDGDIDSLTGQLVFNQPGQVYFKEVKLGLGKSSCAVNGILQNGLWDLKLDGPNLDLGRLSGITGAFFRQFAGQWRGRGRLLGQLQGPFDNPGFVGSLDLLEAEFRDDRLPQPITQLVGNVAFEPGLLTLTEVQGQAGGSPFSLIGKVLYPGQANASPDLTLKGDSLDLALIRALLTSPLVGRSLQVPARSLTQLSGTAQGSLSLQGSQLVGELLFRSASLGLAALPLPLTQLRGTARFVEGSIILDNLRGFMEGSDFTFNGSVRNLTGPLSLEGDLRGQLVFPAALKLLPKAGFQAQGSLPFQVKFASQGDSTLATGDGDAQGLTLVRLGGLDLTSSAFTDASFTALARPNRLEIQQANLSTSDNTLQLTGLARPGSLRFNLTSDPQSLNNVSDLLPWTRELATVAQGQASLDVTLQGTSQQAAWTGGVRLRDLQLALFGGLTLNGTITAEGNGLGAQKLGLLWRNQPVVLGGSYTPGPVPMVNLQLQAQQLDLEKLLSDYEAATQLREWRGQVALTVGSTQLGTLPVQNFKSTVTLGEVLRLAPLTARTSEGQLRGELTVEPSLGRYTGQWNFKAVQLSKVSTALLGWGADSLGTGDVTVTFNGQGKTLKQWLSSLTGQGELQARSPFKWLATLNKNLTAAEYTLSFTLEAGQAKFPKTTFTVLPEGAAEMEGQITLASGQTEAEGLLTLLGQSTRLRLKGLLTEENIVEIRP